MHDSMKSALQRKRARGLDLTIILGGAEPMNSGAPLASEKSESKDAKDLDLAPGAPEGMQGKMHQLLQNEQEEQAEGAIGGNPEHAAKEEKDIQMIKEMIGSHGKGGLNSKVAAHYDQKYGKK